MSNKHELVKTKAEICHSLLNAIEENIQPNGSDGFCKTDASFIMDVLSDISLDRGKTLGIYRHGYNLGTKESCATNFYSMPYVHNCDADKEYNPALKPLRKSLLQKLHLASCSYAKKEYYVSGKYESNMLIFSILDDIQAESVPSPLTSVLAKWEDNSLWEVFLLDNLRFLLPALWHANYKRRQLVCSQSDIETLPQQIRDVIKDYGIDTSPYIDFRDERTAWVTCFYFNKWEGFVKWSIPYYRADERNGVVRIAKVLYPREKKEIIIEHNCGIKY